MADDNGTTPSPSPPEDTGTAEPVPTSERLMGLIGLAVAIGLAVIALDLLTGGGLTRLIPAREPGNDG